MILITGGAGFIGGELARALGESGRRDLIMVDRLGRSAKWTRLRNISYYQDYIHADQLFTFAGDGKGGRSGQGSGGERRGGEDFFSKISFVFHLGACSSTTEQDMDYLMENNVNYSKKIFQKCAEYDIPLVYASSAATYGDGGQGYDDDTQKLRTLRPLNRYGLSKHLFDEWVQEQTRRPPRWFGLKFFNVYGPGEQHKHQEGMASMVYQVWRQLLSPPGSSFVSGSDGRESGRESDGESDGEEGSGRVRLFKSNHPQYADGEQLRDFVYVKDCTRAMVRMMVEGASSGESGLYNLGTGQARSFNDLVWATSKAMGRRAEIDYIPMPTKLQGQYQNYTQAKMDKFKKAFPEFEFSSLEAGVTDYVQNHLAKEVSLVGEQVGGQVGEQVGNAAKS